MKALMTTVLIGFSLALYAQLSHAGQGFSASFLDWADTSPYRPSAPPPAPTASAAEASAGTGLSALHPGLSPHLAALVPGQPLLDDIGVIDESPLEVEPEALADLDYHDIEQPLPVQVETGSSSLAARLERWFH